MKNKNFKACLLGILFTWIFSIPVWGNPCNTSWFHDGYNWYYLNDNGSIATGWIHDGYNWYYLRDNGAMATGWFHDGYNWYYLRDNGAMATGWFHDGYNWYYLRSNGAMATGWFHDDYNWYYLRNNGAMATGWFHDGYNWYYLRSSGAMATGWLKLQGNWYYLNSNGAMLENTWLNEYYLDNNGVWSSPYINLSQMQISQKTSQVIFVEATGTHAQVSMHVKQPNGMWNQILRDNGRIGYGGLGKQKEGDKKTPVGCFSLDEVFGISSDPGAILQYLQVNDGHYWVGDNNSPYYNSLVDINQTGYIFNTKVSEHIISYGKVYNYCIAIGYNKDRIPYKGSAIFLHCSGAGATAGCVSVPEDTMIRIIQNIKDDAMIIIDTSSNMWKY